MTDLPPTSACECYPNLPPNFNPRIHPIPTSQPFHRDESTPEELDVGSSTMPTVLSANMGGPSKAGQSKKRRWGECLSDYTIGSSSQRAPNKASKKDLEQQKHARRPDLAPSPDLFEGFITRIFQLPMEDGSTSVPQVEYPDCLSGDIFDDTSEPGSMDEATATRLEESDRALQGMNLTLTADYVQEVLDHLEKIGPPPTIDSRKSVIT
jgi:hypothetical protein